MSSLICDRKQLIYQQHKACMNGPLAIHFTSYLTFYIANDHNSMLILHIRNLTGLFNNTMQNFLIFEC